MIKRQILAEKVEKKGQTTTTKVKVNRGRRRKTYQTRERNVRNNSKRDRTIEITKNSPT